MQMLFVIVKFSLLVLKVIIRGLSVVMHYFICSLNLHNEWKKGPNKPLSFSTISCSSSPYFYNAHSFPYNWVLPLPQRFILHIPLAPANHHQNQIIHDGHYFLLLSPLLLVVFASVREVLVLILFCKLVQMVLRRNVTLLVDLNKWIQFFC